jgi:bacterioferritin-associated ferredoxin
MRMTGAGTGCTACHRRIRQLLVDRVEPADQCPPSPSPTCVIR